MVELKNINFSYGSTVVFDNFSLKFKENAVNCILGPSGCGKTTLLNILAGLTACGGEVKTDGKGASYVFFEPRLIKEKTVYQNLDIALKAYEKDKAVRKEKIEAFLETVKLGDSGSKYPHELSAGMAQRVSLVRAFMPPSTLLLMDEPFKALDEKTKDGVIDVFLKLLIKVPKTTVFVTHDKNEAQNLGGRIIVFSDKPVKVISEKDV